MRWQEKVGHSVVIYARVTPPPALSKVHTTHAGRTGCFLTQAHTYPTPAKARAGQSGRNSHGLRGPRLHPRDNSLKQHVHYYQHSDQRRPGILPCYLRLLSRLKPKRALATPRPLVHPEPRYAPAPPLKNKLVAARGHYTAQPPVLTSQTIHTLIPTPGQKARW